MRQREKYKYAPHLKRYRKRLSDLNDGKPIYGKTPAELEEKIERMRREAAQGLDQKSNPTVYEYIHKWFELHKQYIRENTAVDYRSTINQNILPVIGDRLIRDITSDDIKETLKSAENKSQSNYNKTDMLLRMIFNAAVESHVIAKNPCPKFKQGGVPPKRKTALTDEQVEILLAAVEGTVADTFVRIALYTGMRREEICALQWDCVFLDVSSPYIEVRRAVSWLHNQPEITDDLKTKASYRNIPIPTQLLDYLKKLKRTAKSDFVVCNRDGVCLSGTQYKNMWHAVVCRSTRERTYTRYLPGGVRETRKIKPKLGEKVRGHNFCYTIDFYVHPHMLRRTYITHLILSGADPKTVQYLAGHKNSKVTMDIYAQVMYNTPKDTLAKVQAAFPVQKKKEKASEEYGKYGD